MADLAAVQAYQAAIRSAQDAAKSPSSPAEQAGGMDFGALVANAVTQTGQSLQGAEAMTAASVTGQAELVDVVTAVSAAEIQLETVVAVRDEVVRAYQEILRMPI